MSKVVFWDFDGTLVHSNHLWVNSMHAAASELDDENLISYDALFELKNKLDYPWDTPEIDYVDAVGTEHWWSKMHPIFEKTLIDAGASSSVAKEAAQNVRRFVLSKDAYIVYPDAVFALETARELGFKNYILSNNYPELKVVLDILDLTKHFDDIVVSGEIGYEKPRLEIFDYARKIAGNPELAIMVGDNPYADIQGGNAAGMVTIFVHRDCEHEADHYLPDYSNIREILTKYL